jgi:hypothetical protein
MLATILLKVWSILKSDIELIQVLSLHMLITLCQNLGANEKKKRIYEADGYCFLIKSCMGFSALFIILLGYYKRFLVIF